MKFTIGTDSFREALANMGLSDRRALARSLKALSRALVQADAKGDRPKFRAMANGADVLCSEAGSTIEFRPFCEDDYTAFAGVESDDPRIADAPWGVVVVDGLQVQAHTLSTVDPNGEGESWGAVWPSEDCALLIAQAVAEGPAAKIGAYLDQIA